MTENADHDNGNSRPLPATTPTVATGKASGHQGYLRYAPIAVILLVIVVGVGMDWHHVFTLRSLIESRTILAGFVSENPTLSIAAFFAFYSAAVAISLPGAVVLTLAGGFLFGWPLGTAVTVAAATTGATALFLAARGAFAGALRKRAGPLLSKVADGFARDAFTYLLVLRLIPVVPFWIVNLAPGLLGMRLVPFVVATAIGIIPATIAFAVIGAGLDAIVAREIAARGDCLAGAACAVDIDPLRLISPELVIGLCALGLLALLPIVFRHFLGRKQST
jgi:uncharacterized membrane protein YdjX (TVP38/TMEM64 family)